MARTTTGTADALAGVPLFQVLSKRELGAVAAVAKELDFEAGAHLIDEGSGAGRLFVIREGTATITVRGSVVKTLGPGDVIGEIALIDGQPRSATVVADTPVRTLSIASFNFRPLLRDHPALTEKLLLEMCRRLREAQGSPAT
jgi:CRP/FNR family transcriptional regulator, cyclic AMP receptor protein